MKKTIKKSISYSVNLVKLAKLPLFRLSLARVLNASTPNSLFSPVLGGPVRYLDAMQQGFNLHHSVRVKLT